MRKPLLIQIVFALVIAIGFGWAALNVAGNLERQGIASGFGFLSSTAGFGIISSLIPWTETSSYGRALVVGLLNTLLVSSLGIVLATILGVATGVARLSPNWLLAKVAGFFVELMRNLPLLLIIFFLYFGVLRLLPSPSESLSLGDVIFLNNRGLYVPWFFSVPELDGFDFTGGLAITPEFIALLAALVLYTAGFIAEIVRGGILAVPPGQREAALALGLSRTQMLRMVILPQALRAIVPPLTSQYLNLTKNSSLAAAIGYPDLVQVFAGTVLSQTGQAVEIIAITMGVYLIISLLIALAMNIWNERTRIIERGAA